MPALAFDSPMTFEKCQNLVEQDNELVEALKRVAQLDFSMLKQKFVEERGWTGEMCDEAEDLYCKFLALNIRYPNRKICPTGPIDEFWHAHILDTRAYADDCQRLFGHMLHHYPYFGMRGPQDRQDLELSFADSVELFIRSFGIDPTAGDVCPRGCRAQKCP